MRPFFVGAALVLALAGCGGSDAGTPAAESNTTVATTPTSFAATGRPATAYTLAPETETADPTLTTLCTVINGNSCLRLAFSRVHEYDDVTIETTKPAAEDLTAGDLARKLAAEHADAVTDDGDRASFQIDESATVVRSVGKDTFVVAQSDTLPVDQVVQRAAAAEPTEPIKLPPQWYLVATGTVETGPDESYDYTIATRSASESEDECMTKAFDAVFEGLREPSCYPMIEGDLDFKVATEDYPLFWGYAPVGTTLVHVVGDGVDTTVEPGFATLNGYATFAVNIAPSDHSLPTFHAFDAEGNQLGTYPDNS